MILSRRGGKVKNYKSSGNSQSSKTTNLAAILSQIPQKSQFLYLIPQKIKTFPQSVFYVFRSIYIFFQLQKTFCEVSGAEIEYTKISLPTILHNTVSFSPAVTSQGRITMASNTCDRDRRRAPLAVALRPKAALCDMFLHPARVEVGVGGDGALYQI